MENGNKRQQIMDASIRLFADQGFENTSIQAIAAAAGVAKGTMYLYFSSKDDLVTQVHAYCHHMDAEACNAGVDQIRGAIAKLCHRFDNIIEYVLSHPLESRIEQLYAQSPQYGGREKESQREMYDAIHAVICLGIRDGELRDMPEDMLTNIYYGIASTMYQMFREEPHRWRDDEMKEKCHELIRDTLSAGS